MNNIKPIGLLGGTFDPIHNGHLKIASECYHNFNWQRVRLIPCQQPVLEKTAYASAAQRLQMLQLAVANEPGLIIDERELTRATPSYTIDTLISLRAEFPATPFCLIIGTDALANLPKWRRWQELVDYAHIVVVPRIEHEKEGKPTLPEPWQNQLVNSAALLGKQIAGLIYYADLVTLPISATQIRQAIAAGLNVRNLLPEPVWEYIQQQKLYRNGKKILKKYCKKSIRRP